MTQLLVYFKVDFANIVEFFGLKLHEELNLKKGLDLRVWKKKQDYMKAHIFTTRSPLVFFPLLFLTSF
jgi:hypothetical protein